MWQKFSDETQQAIYAAQRIAVARGISLVDIPHLLLGILEFPETAGCVVLQQRGVSLPALQREVESLVPRVVSPGVLPEPTLTPTATRVLEFAADEARRMKYRYILTAHVIIALRRHKGATAQILIQHGLEPRTLRAAVRQHIEKALSSEVPTSAVLSEIDLDLTWRRFNAEAREVFLRSAKEAELMQSRHVEPEHLLLALLEPSCGAAQVLEKIGIPAERVQLELLPRLRPGRRSTANPILSPKSRLALEMAVVEAQQMQHTVYGPEHIFLGLLRLPVDWTVPVVRFSRTLNLPISEEIFAPRNAAVQVLTALNIDLRSARFMVLDHLGDPARDPWQRNLTPTVRQVLTVAHELTWLTGCGFIHPGHLLLGLLHSDELAFALFREFEAGQVDLPALREAVRHRVTSDGAVGTNQIHLSDEARRVFKRAGRLAVGHQQRLIRADFLLVSLLQEKEDPALEPLRALGLDTKAILKKLKSG